LSGFAIWLYLSALLLFGMGYLFQLFFVVRNNAVQYRSNVKWCHLIWPLCSCTAPGSIKMKYVIKFTKW